MDAPGGPGIPPTWTSSAKDMIGTALGPSRLWFTVGFGILNEIYYPRVDLPQTRDLGFIIADGKGFWCEVKRNNDYTLSTPAPGVPAVHLLHRHPRFEFGIRIAPDPVRDVLLVELILTGDPDLKPYVLLAPHLGQTGYDNSAEVFMDRGRVALCAEQGASALALCAVGPEKEEGWSRASAGYVGVTDGWQDFSRNGRMTWTYGRAGPGNVALTGELPRHAMLALGFGTDKQAATTLALSALNQRFDTVWHRYAEAWQQWQDERVDADRFPIEFRDQLAVSAMVLKAHQDKTYPGAMVASLSIPWGSRSDDVGGYHLMWPRDLVESAGALIELRAFREARDILRYLIATQLHDGHWFQNQWLGGTPRWSGVQLDEAAFPVLLAAALADEDQLDGIEAGGMVRRALGFIVRNGPSTDQDRWEESAGLNPFTLAIAIAAIVAGAELMGSPEERDLLALADDWNSRIEEWCVVRDSALSTRYGVGPHYVHVAPDAVMWDPKAFATVVRIRNRNPAPALPASEQIATDYLQLVRFGLRRADDPFIRNTLALQDKLLRTDTPNGPSWHRYNEDGYGEHDDGRPYDGTGKGRLWPLLTGERGHYALAAGEDARPYLRAMMHMAGKGSLLPEQVWDAEPIPQRFLFPGRPSGSAMPLVWAHAEFIKLAASIRRGYPVDRPAAAWLRYQGETPRPDRAHWTRAARVGTIRRGQALRIVLEAPSIVRWSHDGWASSSDVETRAGMLGLAVVDIASEALPAGTTLRFAIQTTGGGWDGEDYRIDIVEPAALAAEAPVVVKPEPAPA
jgi:glucoamylase